MGNSKYYRSKKTKHIIGVHYEGEDISEVHVYEQKNKFSYYNYVSYEESLAKNEYAIFEALYQESELLKYRVLEKLIFQVIEDIGGRGRYKKALSLVKAMCDKSSLELQYWNMIIKQELYSTHLHHPEDYITDFDELTHPSLPSPELVKKRKQIATTYIKKLQNDFLSYLKSDNYYREIKEFMSTLVIISDSPDFDINEYISISKKMRLTSCIGGPGFVKPKLIEVEPPEFDRNNVVY